jgi:NAD(P)-dependent dehydrogenase (short-subunit alcohol dehydrogenase family)
MGLLTGKVAVVTGSGRGIGRAVALAFAREGAEVVITARNSQELDRVSDEVHYLGGTCTVVPADVTRQQDVDRLFAAIHKELGQVDILVNNAGALGPIEHFEDADMDAWQDIFEVNVIGLARCIRAALPTMIERRSGKIINVGSDAARSDGWAASNFEHTAYAASKAAVIRLTEVLAVQVRPYGINVNCVGAWADTVMSVEARQRLARLRGEKPMGALDEIPVSERVDPEENAPLFVFLASSLSHHITGQYIEANSLPDYLRIAE